MKVTKLCCLILLILTLISSNNLHAQCKQFSAKDLLAFLGFNYNEVDSALSTKGYSIRKAEEDNSEVLAQCDQNKVNSLSVKFGSHVYIINASESYTTSLISQFKSKGFKLISTEKPDESGTTAALYRNKTISFSIVRNLGKSPFIMIDSRESLAQENETETTQDFNEEEKVVAKKMDDNSLEIDSYTNTTDIGIKKGETILIEAQGKITYGVFAGSGGPDGIDGYTSYSRIQGFRHGSLLARIGDKGKWEAVGTSKKLVAASSGILQFIVNDEDPSNNSGAFTVDIMIKGVSGAFRKVFR